MKGGKKMKKCRSCGAEIESGLYCSKCFQGDNNDDKLNEIFDYLGLNEQKDGRLRVKADIMKKVIQLSSKWKTGNMYKWIDWLATRTCVSTRKIREDYVFPLISEGILAQLPEDVIRFIGLPQKERE